MYRRFLVLTVAVAVAVLSEGISLGQAGGEFDLPPVKLRPTRPSTAKPIPPSPDEREAPKETPPAEKPDETPKESPPAEKPAAPPKATAGEEEAPKAPAEKPARAPRAPKGTPPAETPASPPKEVPPPELPAPPPVEVPAARVPPAEVPAEPSPAKPTARPVRTDLPPTIPAPETPPELPAPPMPPAPRPVAQPSEVLTPAALPAGPRPADIHQESVEAQTEGAPRADLTGLGEVGLVEEVARARKAYGRALQALHDFYVQRGTAFKLEWLDGEMRAYGRIPRVQYLGVAELAGPELKPLRPDPAADQLFTDGMNYKNYPAFPPGKKDYLKLALEKFQTIVEKYPDSDKIDDAAFRMGEIYGGWYFEDWARAVQCYERCWQWDAKTQYPAMFNAAKIYDEKLKNRLKAVELYNRVLAESNDQDLINQARNRIRDLTGK